MDETEPVMMRATCRTDPDVCPVSGQTFTVPMHPNAAPPIFRAQCDQCGQLVTDLVPV
ncbi:hypothetical protein ACIPQA_33725 [Streptomyces sp. NPDC090109]|uniref:hypothetical protein n=1 Tax=Streptomyces sp. NPDC090109 TaxID=3365948 RepID=UPI003801E387